MENQQPRISRILKTLFGREVKHSEPTTPMIPKSELSKVVQEEMAKSAALMSMSEAVRYARPYLYNSQTNPDRKPGGDIPFSYMRRMATLYPIARACINRRIRQITMLSWDITTIDEIENEDGYESQIAQVKEFFKRPLGFKSRMREFLTIMVDDLLTLDAIAFEMRKTRSRELLSLIPVDPSTIVLRVTESGATPEPPETAYEQVILGQVVAQFSTDEMIYDSLGSRSYSPYGLAPLESLIIQVESALRGSLYNLNYLQENNVPEGFVTLPPEVATSKAKVEEWQGWFDSIVAGDSQMTHRLKMLPGGSEYISAKKPEDMAFERFEMWLLQQTCAVFDVQPQDIGITYQVNKATGESQGQLSDEKGLYPLANFIKEIFDDIIQVEFGQTNLQFIWRDLVAKDRKAEIEIAEKEIKLGALSVDEYRAEQGREPIGLEHYIMTGKGPLKVVDFQSDDYLSTTTDQQNSDTNNTNEDDAANDEKKMDDEAEKAMLLDVRRWKKCILADLKNGKELRTRFPADSIPDDVRESIVKGLRFVDTKEKAQVLFDQFLDPHIRSSMTLLKYAQHLREINNDLQSK